MSRPRPSLLLESALLAAVMAAVAGLAPVSASGPANSGRHPQSFEVHAPMPMNRYGPPRIPIYRQPAANEWVSTIFSRIASAASLEVGPQPDFSKPPEEEEEETRKHEADLPDSGRKIRGGKKGSTITILEWDIINAFATPGEKLYVTTGLLSTVESDDELAAVIAHEIAHVRLDHIEKRMKRQMVSSFLAALATIRAGSDAFLAGQALSTLPVMPYGQDQELQADRAGIEYLAAAGYDPNGAVEFLRRLQDEDAKHGEKSTSGIGSLLQSHPPTPRRVELAIAQLDRMGVPTRRPSHLGYDFKLDTLAIDLTGLEFLRGTQDETLPLSTPSKVNVITSMKIQGNLIEGGDFDGASAGSDPPPGWKAVKGTAEVADRDGKDGSRAIALWPDERGTAEVEGPAIPIDPDQDYLLSGYIRSGDRHERLSLGLRYLDEARQEIRTDYPAAEQEFVPGEWTRYQGVIFSRGNTFSLPREARYTRVVLRGTYTTRAPSWFDDLALVQVGK